jgi:hypothetical protein
MYILVWVSMVVGMSAACLMKQCGVCLLYSGGGCAHSVKAQGFEESGMFRVNVYHAQGILLGIYLRYTGVQILSFI